MKDLTFIPQGAHEPALDNVSLALPKGSRALLVGANGGQTLFLFPVQIIHRHLAQLENLPSCRSLLGKNSSREQT